MIKKYMILSLLFITTFLLAGCKESNKVENISETFEDYYQCTANSEIYDITRHDCQQYQWFVMDAGEKVLECGVTVDTPPEIVDENDIVSVYIETAAGKGEYREYYPSTGEMSQWYERRSEENGEFIYFTANIGEFVFPEVLEAFWDVEEGVNRDSFVNFEEADTPIEDYDSAYERAKNEISSSSYNTVAIDYDKEHKMWAVTFSDKDSEDSVQTVYLDSSGKTWIIITDNQ